MAFVLTELTDFVKEVSQTINSELYFGDNTERYFTPIISMKGTQKLNYFETELDPILDACGYSGTTTTTFSQRSITVEAVKNEAGYCPKRLEKKWLGQLMKRGTTHESFPFQDFIMEDLIAQLGKKNALIKWKGDTNGSTGTSLDLADGILTILTGETSKVECTLTGTTTVSNVSDKVNEIITNLPTAIKDKQIQIFTSLGNVQLYDLYLFNANLFHVTSENTGWETVVPYMKNVKLVGVEAFGSDDKYLATFDGNLLHGVDDPAEMENPEVWYNRDEQEIRIRNSWKVGAQVVFPEYCVTNNI